MHKKIQNYKDRRLRKKIVKQMIGHAERSRVHEQRLRNLDRLAQEIRYRDMKNRVYYGIKHVVPNKVAHLKSKARERVDLHRLRLADRGERMKGLYHRVKEFRYRPESSHWFEFLLRATTTLIVISAIVVYIEDYLSIYWFLGMVSIVILVDFVLYYLFGRH